MKTENLINYSAATIREFYAQGIITQAQYEAFDFIWANTHITSFPYYYSSLLPDARSEMWKLYKVCPPKVQKIIRASTVK